MCAIRRRKRQIFTIPPEPVKSVLTDRTDASLKRIEVSGGSITLAAVSDPDAFDGVYGPFDGPMLAQEDPLAFVRLYVTGGSLVFEAIAMGDRHWGVRHSVIAKDPSTGGVYRLLYPVGGSIVLEDIT